MVNIFKNAYFGKAYKTKDGRKALYLKYCNSSKYHELITDDLQDLECDDYGFFIEDDIDNNIVSEWQEETNEEELKNVAFYEANKKYYNDCNGDSIESFEYERNIFIEGFLEGYHKNEEHKHR